VANKGQKIGRLQFEMLFGKTWENAAKEENAV
jgi:hypothetical protein